MTAAPWPEMESTRLRGSTLREHLDYLVWVCGQMQELGFHGGADGARWAERVRRAYMAVFMPIIAGSGPPYPPDVPGARSPGIWPDVPASGIPGMTLRHQLASLQYRCMRLRDRPRPHMRQVEVVEWDRRLSLAREAMDHGDSPAMPSEARTQPSPAAVAEAKAQDEARKLEMKKRQGALRAQMRRRQARAPKAAAASTKSAAVQGAAKTSSKVKPAKTPKAAKAPAAKAAKAPKAPKKAKTAKTPKAAKAAKAPAAKVPKAAHKKK